MPLAKQLCFKSFSPFVKLVGVAIASSTLLVGCGGGGGGSSEQSTQTTRIIAFGDSTTDSGTFGGKYIVNNATPFGEGSNSIWIDSIAQAIGIDEVCPYYNYAGTVSNIFLAADYSSTPACTNFAVGAGRINAVAGRFNSSAEFSVPALAADANAALSPLSVPMQMATAANLLTFSSADLVLISVSGNDLADLIGPLLQALGGTTTNLNSLLVLGGISQAVIDATVTAELAKVGAGQTYATQALAVAGAYLQLTAGYVGGLATGLHSAVTTRLLDAGVEKLVVLNMPNALATPLFQGALPQLIQDAATRAAAEAVIKDLIGVYNVQLSALFAGDARVIVYDLNGLLTEVVNVDAAAALGFSNTTFPTCGATLSARQCSEAVASATVQAVYGAGTDWEAFLWADTFHPSELAHDVISERVVSAMQARGWH